MRYQTRALALCLGIHLVAGANVNDAEGQSADPGILISEVVSGALDNPTTLFAEPSWVEITNCGHNLVDLSLYSIGHFPSGLDFLFGGASTLLRGTLGPGESYIYVFGSPRTSRFEEIYGFTPDQFQPAGIINGDDAVALFFGEATQRQAGPIMGTFVDIYGCPDVDGTGEPWDYTDGYARRRPDATQRPGWSASNLPQWFFGGNGSLDGVDDADDIKRVQTLTFPGQHQCTLADPGILITEVVDGNLSGGRPKWVEITNCGENDVDLSSYSIGNFNNGGLNLGGDASTPLIGAIGAGESFLFEYDSKADSRFEEVYGFPSDQFAGSGFINGNDVVALFFGPASTDGNGNLDGTLLDAYGELGVDGEGEMWEYTDGYARRLPGSTQSVLFNPADWDFGGIDSLGGGNEATDIELLQTATFPGQHECGVSLIRGDCDGDSVFNGLLDGLFALAFQFQNGPSPACLESCDADADGLFNGLLDALTILAHQFQMGPPPGAPYPDCGVDPNPTNSLGCDPNGCP